jgi:hypothetical protein
MSASAPAADNVSTGKASVEPVDGGRESKLILELLPHGA